MYSYFFHLTTYSYEWIWTIAQHGPDGLHMTGMTPDELRSMVKTIDAEKANCFSDEDKEKIRGDILENHKTFDQFNNMIKVSVSIAIIVENAN